VSTAVGGSQYDGEKDTVGNGNLGLVLYSDLGGIASTVFLMAVGEDSGEAVRTDVAGVVEVEVHDVAGVKLVVGEVLCHQPVVVVGVGQRFD